MIRCLGYRKFRDYVNIIVTTSHIGSTQAVLSKSLRAPVHIKAERKMLCSLVDKNAGFGLINDYRVGQLNSLVNNLALSESWMYGVNNTLVSKYTKQRDETEMNSMG